MGREITDFYLVKSLLGQQNFDIQQYHNDLRSML